MFKTKGILVTLLLLPVLALTNAAPTKNQSLLKTLNEKGSANIIIRMAGGTAEVLAALNNITFSDLASRLNTVARTLKSHSAQSQKNVLNFLSTVKGLDFQSFWISNEIFIPQATAQLVIQLGTFNEVVEIYEEHVVLLDEPLDFKMVDKSEANPMIEAGIELIEAHRAWAELSNNGEGAVVANIDTGVRHTHEALRDNFLGPYGWFDPPFKTLDPDDRHGHGTHTVGTIAGSHGIGVAPGAKWIACRGCASSACAQSDLIACFQFFTCPTLADGSQADCSKAPHLVSNSWGSFRDVYDPYIQGLRTAGIIPVFSNGNSGPLCGSVNSPADSVVGVIGVGATKFSDALASFSSVGPSVHGHIKPDISAPGQNVRSAYNSADNAYASMSGTSMAAPHVAGVVGLLFAENQGLSYDEVANHLNENTEQNIIPTGRNCGGIDESIFPNNAFGSGRLNAFKSLRALQQKSLR